MAEKPTIYAEYDWDAICKHEWEKISDYGFFRRDGSFYLIDLKEIYLMHVGFSGYLNNFDYNISVLADGEIVSKTIIKGQDSWFLEQYKSDDLCSYKIQIPFDLMTHSSAHNRSHFEELIKANRIAIRVHVFDYEFGKGTERELDVVIKYLHEESLKKKSAMVCSKSFAYSKKSAKDFEWWIEINKRMGFEKISLFNNSLEYSASGEDGYERVLKKYSGYVELIQMNCLPYYLSNRKPPNGSQFVRSFFELVNSTGILMLEIKRTYEIMAVNICYLNHAQDYRHIAIMDMDEIFLPPLIEGQFSFGDNFDFIRQLSLNDQNEAQITFDRLRCNRYPSFPNDISKTAVDTAYQSQVERYVEDIISRDPQYQYPQSLYFENAWQITTQSMSSIVDQIDEYFSKNTPNKRLDSGEHFVDLIDDTMYSWTGYGTYFSIKISGPEEIAYAKNLVKVFKLYVRPFLNNLKVNETILSNLYDRFFSISSAWHHQFAWGKTIHNTLSTRSFNHHYPVDGPVYKDVMAPTYKVDFSVGQMFHFRAINKIREDTLLSVRKLTFNLNYFNCFFKPILSDMIKERTR